jgi:hypothetical protein
MIRGCPIRQDRKPPVTLSRRAYATDLTDAEWQLLARWFRRQAGRPTTSA